MMELICALATHNTVIGAALMLLMGFAIGAAFGVIWAQGFDQ